MPASRIGMLAANFPPGNMDNAFAQLTPQNPNAKEAFHETVKTVLSNPDMYHHASQFIYTEQVAAWTWSELSTTGDTFDGLGADLEHGPAWMGVFKLELTALPTDEAGWILGTGADIESVQDVDLLLTPDTPDWQLTTRIAGKHARLRFHPESWTLLLEALHTVSLAGHGSTKVYKKESRVVHHGDSINIGNCQYIFEFCDLYYSAGFQEDMKYYMCDHLGHPHKLHTSLTAPTAEGNKLRIGDFTFSAGAFAAGTYGRVAGGYAGDGSCVAVKHFKLISKPRLDHHKKIMRKIAYHTNIVQLVACISDFESKLPGVFCFYKPLCYGSLTTTLEVGSVDKPTLSALFYDWLVGLEKMHVDLKMMHRDIKPNNLGIVRLNPPHGVLLDLDCATTEKRSIDWKQGTGHFMAPEIIALRFAAEETSQGKSKTATMPAYNRQVDLWSFGISIWTALDKTPMACWCNLDPTAEQIASQEPEAWKKDCMTRPRYDKWRSKLAAKRDLVRKSDPVGFKLLTICENLAEWDPEDRMNVSRALKHLQKLKRDR